jgi:hypothetical protein
VILKFMTSEARAGQDGAIQVRPHRGGWKVFEAPGVEPFYLDEDAKEKAIGYAKHRQRSNSRPIRILDLTGTVIELVEPSGQ